MRFFTGLLAGLAIDWLVFPYIFQMQVYNQQLDEISYAKLVEQTTNENPSASGR
jgi:hypothetical protein